MALLLQSLAPLQIAPPRGQAVHFAHTEHAGHGDRSDRSGAPREEPPACPVCHALQAGGSSIGAHAVLPAFIPIVHPTAALPAEIEARALTAPARPHARAPPMSA